MDNQSTPPMPDPAAAPADQGAPAADAPMTGDQVVDKAKEVLSSEPAMDMGSAPAAPANDAPAGDVPSSPAPSEPAPEAPATEAASMPPADAAPAETPASEEKPAEDAPADSGTPPTATVG